MNATLKGTPRERRRRHRFVGTCGLPVLLLLALGCPGTPMGGGGSDGTSGSAGDDVLGTASAAVVGLSLVRILSERDPPISITYSVRGNPDSIAAFFVQVADTNPSSPPIPGEPAVTLRENLPTSGPNLQFSFDPSVAGVGFFRVGLRVSLGGEVTESTSVGVINVRGLPHPVFVEPGEPVVEVVQGEPQLVTFDASAPLGVVQWRLFFLFGNDSRNDRPDLLGTEIAVGEGNIGAVNFSTVGLPAGDYELGVSATDTGRSIADEAAIGDIERIVTVFGPVVRIMTETAPAP